MEPAAATAALIWRTTAASNRPESGYNRSICFCERFEKFQSGARMNIELLLDVVTY